MLLYCFDATDLDGLCLRDDMSVEKVPARELPRHSGA